MVCSQPRIYDRQRTVFFGREARADQYLTHNDIGTGDHEVDGSKPGLTGVRKSALDDMCNPVWSCVGHEDRIERDPVARRF
jgi:hypothetical protein